MVWLAVAAIVVVALGLYAHWAARRLDRLHRRLDAAAAALDDQLRTRAELAAVLATGAAARAPSLAAGLAADAADARARRGLDHDRELAESALSRLLVDAVAVLGADPASADVVAAAVDAHLRVGFARSFHNDAVRDALVVRRRWIVRLMHLAGHAPRPAYFEIDAAPVEIPRAGAVAAPYD